MNRNYILTYIFWFILKIVFENWIYICRFSLCLSVDYLFKTIKPFQSNEYVWAIASKFNNRKKKNEWMKWRWKCHRGKCYRAVCRLWFVLVLIFGFLILCLCQCFLYLTIHRRHSHQLQRKADSFASFSTHTQWFTPSPFGLSTL